MTDREIAAVPVGRPGATFKKINLKLKDDLYEVYDKDVYVGTIQEMPDLGLWRIRVKGIILYTERRAFAAQLTCIINSYTNGEVW